MIHYLSQVPASAAMKYSRKHVWFMIAAIALTAPSGRVFAQLPDAIRKTEIPSLNQQVGARFDAFERRLDPLRSPELAAGSVAQLIGASPFNALARLIANPRSADAWEQAPDRYVGLIHESGGALITWPTSPPRYGVAWSSGQVRRLCQERLTMLPPAALRSYRALVQAEVKSLLEQARRTHATAPLRKIIEEHYASGSADSALDLLGDLAFERGDFAEAGDWWRMLAGESLYPAPSPNGDIARNRAKCVLALMFAGRFDDAQQAIRGFRKQHPDAKGALAGREGLFHVILQQTLEGLAEARIFNNDAPWATFAGEPSRNRILSECIHWHLWEDGPAWRVALPSLESADTAKNEVSQRNPKRLLAFHPVIAADQVFLADHRSVVGYHLFTGKETLRFDLGAPGFVDPGLGVGPEVAAPRFTLSTDGQRLYARLGPARIGPRKNGIQPSYIVCLDITDPGVRKNRLLWRLKSQADDRSETDFEGAPLVHAGRVYVASTKVANRQASTSIECYDTAGRQRWSRAVCETPEFEQQSEQPRHQLHLLTLAAGQIVYCSHSGAVVAVDAATGVPTWAVRYPSRGPLLSTAEPSPRDLSPCVYADGLIVAAPLDLDRVLAMDAWTGRVRWEVESIEVTQLLGIARGRVYATTRSGVVAIDSATGGIVWQQPTAGRLPGLGRAVISGGWLIWSTQDAKLPYRALSLATGDQEKNADETSILREPRRFDPTLFHALPVGNWAIGQGCLVIAGTKELTVYLPPDKQPKLAPAPRLQPQAKVLQKYREARLEAQAGDALKAYANFASALPAGRDARPWRELAAVRMTNLKNTAQPLPAGLETPSNVVPKRQNGAGRTTPVAPPNLPIVRTVPQIAGVLCPGTNDDPTGIFFAQTGGELVCYSVNDDKPRWRMPRDVEPRWLGCWRDRVVLFSDDAVEARAIADGALAWRFRLKNTVRKLATVETGQPRIRRVSTGVGYVEIVGDVLFFVDDSRYFYRLNLEDGRVTWQYAPKDADIRPLDSAAFSPFLASIGDAVVVQRVDGQPMMLGTSLTPIAQPSRPWRQAPAVLGKRAVFAGEAGTISAFDIGNAATLAWTWTPALTSSLTGEPFRLAHANDVLLALIPRNDGVDWARLNPAKGQTFWTVDAKPARALSEFGAITIGELSFFYVLGDYLYARSLNDGRLEWKQNLLPGKKNWAVRYTKNYLVVYPSTGTQKAGFSVDFLDPWTGERLQRLAFPHAVGPCRLAIARGNIRISDGAAIHTFRSLPLE